MKLSSGTAVDHPETARSVTAALDSLLGASW